MLIRSIQEVRSPHESDIAKQVRVPSGMWVTRYSVGEIFEKDPDANSLYSRWKDGFSVVGIRPHQAEIHLTSYGEKEYEDGGHKHWQEFMMVSQKPHGVILSTMDGRGRRAGGRMLVCARRVEHGEIGRPLRVKTPRFVRSSYTARVQNDTVRITGWSKLTNVAAFTGMRAHEVLERYFPFTHKRFPRLYVAHAHHPGQIKKRHAKVRGVGERRLPELFERDPETIWIPQYFAITILRLVRMRYIP